MNASARTSKILRAQIPEPSFLRLFLLAFALSCLLFIRPLNTNFIFDEQEALLANPYVGGELPLHHVLQVDFWGRSPAQTIGSYRPLPNLLWRMFSWSMRFNTPWFFGLLNLVAHALTGTFLVRAFVGALRGGVSTNLAPAEGSISLHVHGAWLLGILFITSAVATEAVSGVVGLADLLVGLAAAISVWAMVYIQRWSALVAVLFCAIFLGCLSKETMLTLIFVLPSLGMMLPFTIDRTASWVRAPERSQLSMQRPAGQQSLIRACLVGGTFVLAQLAAVLVRKQFFPTPIEGSRSSDWGAGVDAAVRFWASPQWPWDELNNPLLTAEPSVRVATAAVIYLEQLIQFVFPFELSGDYSAPAQAIHHWHAWSLCGAALFCVTSLWAVSTLLFQLLGRERSWWSVGMALSMIWVNLCFLPVSGALVALPTIRAERLFYPASLGASLALLLLLVAAWSHANKVLNAKSWQGRVNAAFLALSFTFVVFQAVQARRHAFDYSSDLSFWRATSEGKNPSAKSFLNWGVMLGARGDLDARLLMTKRALGAVPNWPMGEIYLGDTYCRRGELELAKPHYLHGLAATFHSKSLSALSLQCIWDHGKFQAWSSELHQIADQHPDSWLSYLVDEIEKHGEENNGISAKYRPRQYNQRSGAHAIPP